MLGAVYLIAFFSLGSQIRGLVGSRGIEPAAGFLKAVETHYGPGAFWKAPTLCWWNAGDDFLALLCYGGAALSCLLILDFAPAAL